MQILSFSLNLLLFSPLQSKPVYIPPPTLRPQHVYAPVAPLGMLSLGVLSKHKDEVERTFRTPCVEGGPGGGGGGSAKEDFRKMMQGESACTKIYRIV